MLRGFQAEEDSSTSLVELDPRIFKQIFISLYKLSVILIVELICNLNLTYLRTEATKSFYLLD